MNNEAQLITHYYFCTGVIDRLDDQNRTPAELFGDGELELIQNLCRYSQIISEIEHGKNDEEGFPGVFDLCRGQFRYKAQKARVNG